MSTSALIRISVQMERAFECELHGLHSFELMALEILNPFGPVWIHGIQLPCALFTCECNYSSLCLHVN